MKNAGCIRRHRAGARYTASFSTHPVSLVMLTGSSQLVSRAVPLGLCVHTDHLGACESGPGGGLRLSLSRKLPPECHEQHRHRPDKLRSVSRSQSRSAHISPSPYPTPPRPLLQVNWLYFKDSTSSSCFLMPPRNKFLKPQKCIAMILLLVS